jgi:hypothetical protein
MASATIAAVATTVVASAVVATVRASVIAATAVKPAVAASTVEATPATTMKTAAATAVAATLGERRTGRANQSERRDRGKESLQQGGFPHINTLHPNGGGLPGRANRLQISYALSGRCFQGRSCPRE